MYDTFLYFLYFDNNSFVSFDETVRDLEVSRSKGLEPYQRWKRGCGWWAGEVGWKVDITSWLYGMGRGESALQRASAWRRQ